MILARFLSKFFTKRGIVLIDSEGQKYICGEILNKEKHYHENQSKWTNLFPQPSILND